MTGSFIIAIGATVWSIIAGTFPALPWIVAISLFLLLAMFRTLRKYVQLSHDLKEQLRSIRTPKMSIVTAADDPYVKIGNRGHTIAVAVRNDSDITLTRVRVRIEQCVPSSTAIVSAQYLEPSSDIGTIAISPHHDEFFNFIVADVNEKQSRVSYRVNPVNGSDGVIDLQEREVTLSATCDESTPARRKFRLTPREDGFFTLCAIDITDESS